MLALFAEMERTYSAERVAHASAVAAANGWWIGRPSVVDPAKLEHAVMLRDKGASIPEITEKTGLKRTTLYRHGAHASWLLSLENKLLQDAEQRRKDARN